LTKTSEAANGKCKITVLYLPGSLNYISYWELNNFAEHKKILPGSMIMRKRGQNFQKFSEIFLPNASIFVRRP